jgi:maltooligosyltrehalose trehalohydrolase
VTGLREAAGAGAMQRRHEMPFGATLLGDGRTRFRLWAPALREVVLELATPSARAALPMSAAGEGWHQLTCAAPCGTRYAFRVDASIAVPDPASRFNPEDVHAPSMVVDPLAYAWRETGWRGRPWEEAVIYELHVGTFTPAGTFAGVIERLDHLADLGVTALELMPVAEFPGGRNWGYDGVLPFAPDARYGTPEELKRLVDAAHERGLMVLLDVVYNHFGPEGNYLHLYAPQFFNPARHTPWGAAIDFDGAAARTVRDFFVHNALYWLEEYCFDGLRLDAVHAIADGSSPDIVEEIARAAQAGPGRERHVHVVLENDHNCTRYLARDGAGRPLAAVAQWNDDVHHAAHVLLTGERDGYYADYADRPLERLGRCLAEGFAYQGEPSPYRGGAARGEPSAGLPASAFVNFLQTHDQVGNRAFGERIGKLAAPAAVDAMLACLLLAPAPPMLFMGEEFDASSPFLFFCDFGPDLAAAVRDGRREEFGRFERFRDAAARNAIPDPGDAATFERSKLDWAQAELPGHADRLALVRRLLALRHRHVAPRLARHRPPGTFDAAPPGALAVRWAFTDGAVLHLAANLAPEPSRLAPPPGAVVYANAAALSGGRAGPWSVLFSIEEEAGDDRA